MSESQRYNSIFRSNLFSGQVALVTGGGTGIGRCIAHELAALGAHVVIGARRLEPLQAVVAEIEAAGGSAEAVELNIRKTEVVDSVIADIVARHEHLDLLVNNAGGQFPSPAANIPEKGWRAVIDTNLNGTFFVSQAAYRHSMEARGGSIVTIVADMWNGFPMMSHTGAARAGVVNLTKSLAVEWAASGVRVNAVAPGVILSNGLNNYDPFVLDMLENVMHKQPAARLGTESEVSSAVCFLLSPAAAYISGDTLRVDGASSLVKPVMFPVGNHDRSPVYDGFHLSAELPERFKKGE